MATRSISDEKVFAATGRRWDEWMAFLDEKQGTKLDHKGLVALLKEENVGAWWQQSISGQYERERGMRKQHEMPNGFQVGATKTVNVPVADLWEWVESDEKRESWVEGADWTVRKATQPKSMRITWKDEKSTIDIYFYDKGPAKSSIQLNHNKLPDADVAEELKSYWKSALVNLKKQAESNA